jgi:hypothetical protein
MELCPPSAAHSMTGISRGLFEGLTGAENIRYYILMPALFNVPRPVALQS